MTTVSTKRSCINTPWGKHFPPPDELPSDQFILSHSQKFFGRAMKNFGSNAAAHESPREFVLDLFTEAARHTVLQGREGKLDLTEAYVWTTLYNAMLKEVTKFKKGEENHRGFVDDTHRQEVMRASGYRRELSHVEELDIAEQVLLAYVRNERTPAAVKEVFLDKWEHREVEPSHRETAERVGSTENGVAKSYQRGKDDMRRVLGGLLDNAAENSAQ